MNYAEAREYITGLQKSGIKLGLGRMRNLMHVLEDPQDSLKFIHVAGTNGKGSTCTFICTMLAANGFRVGMYTSPAVSDVREQYVINGEWIDEEEYAECAACAEQAVKEICSHSKTDDELMPTSYEFETAMAFIYFKRKKCDYVVLETGLGGREDATNIVNTTVLSVITSISEDHLGMIGNNITEIARTKAGIIKPGIPVVMADGISEVENVIRDECRITGSKLFIVDRSQLITYGSRETASDEGKDAYCLRFDYREHKSIRLATCGAYQADNAALALDALDVLKQYDVSFRPEDKKCRDALYNVRILYRMEKICDKPLLYVDGAHNPGAALRLKETIDAMLCGYRLIFIIGMFRDKDYRQVIRTTVPSAYRIFTVETPDSGRALPAIMLRDCIIDCLGKEGLTRDAKEVWEDRVTAVCDIKEAVRLATEAAEEAESEGSRACIIAFGSLSYLKFVRQYISDDFKRMGSKAGE